LILSCALPNVLALLTFSREFDWEEVYGEDGQHLIHCMRSYDYSAHHPMLTTRLNGDWLNTAGGWSPLMHRWGDVTSTEGFIDAQIAVCRRMLDDQDGDGLAALEHAAMLFGMMSFAWQLLVTEVTHGREKLLDLLREVGLTYQNAHTAVDNMLTPWVRPRGDDTKNVHYCSREHTGEMGKQFVFLLASTSAATAPADRSKSYRSRVDASPEQILSEMPSISDIVLTAMTYVRLCPAHAHTEMNIFVSSAKICEVFGQYERAVDYADAAASSDLSQAGTLLPMPRVDAQRLRGRCLAKLGRQAEAAAAFEAAAEEAQRFGLRLCEAYALRDLKLCVHDPMGHGDHASRRLGAALRLLKGPADKLTPLLQGLDAAELMALPPPDTSYRVVYERQQEQQQQQQLRGELSAMKLKALKRRARESGVEEEHLEDADDADEPKATVIQLILDRESTAGAGAGGAGSDDPAASSSASTALAADVAAAAAAAAASRQALVSELGGLKLKVLKKRARAAGVDEEKLEDTDDADDIKGAVIALIVHAELSLADDE
jgi:tetratricopeptide (TPR) repeat protein